MFAANPLLPAEASNAILMLTISAGLVWLYTVYQRWWNVLALRDAIPDGTFVLLRGLSHHVSSFHSMTRSHLTALVHTRQAAPPQEVPRLKSPFSISEPKCEALGGTGKVGVSFELDSSVPCSVQLVWDVSDRDLAALMGVEPKQQAEAAGGDRRQQRGGSGWQPRHRTSRRGSVLRYRPPSLANANTASSADSAPAPADASELEAGVASSISTIASGEMGAADGGSSLPHSSLGDEEEAGAAAGGAAGGAAGAAAGAVVTPSSSAEEVSPPRGRGGSGRWRALGAANRFGISLGGTGSSSAVRSRPPIRPAAFESVPRIMPAGKQTFTATEEECSPPPVLMGRDLYRASLFSTVTSVPAATLGSETAPLNPAEQQQQQEEEDQAGQEQQPEPEPQPEPQQQQQQQQPQQQRRRRRNVVVRHNLVVVVKSLEPEGASHEIGAPTGGGESTSSSSSGRKKAVRPWRIRNMSTAIKYSRRGQVLPAAPGGQGPLPASEERARAPGAVHIAEAAATARMAAMEGDVFDVQITKQSLAVEHPSFSAGGGGGSGSSGMECTLYTVGEVYGIDGGEDGEDEECIICLTDPKDTVLLPCRHLCCCAECFPHIDKCPVCRAPFNDYIVQQPREVGEGGRGTPQQ